MWAITLAFGLTLGSFMNVVIHRVPIMLENRRQRIQGWSVPKYNLSYPNSSCVKCNHEIRWYENIPVFSYLALRGKCSHCDNKISLRYPLIELAFGVAALMVHQWLI
ncbi:MAG: hypothetical protein CTY35_02050 [Methylotenera sp.]|uniref:prepilin peptidase n=1 Tax=Methylotenera sp. TaxID=2051956 RepID=UPI000D420E20|nr:MAG: hypothetical protein CTY38_02270 [Methylotenera sp.]PPD01058.1 MAG: hypothetical protein CTY35_02050 [Methylotenera sp.]